MNQSIGGEGSHKLSKQTDFASPVATYWGIERDSQGNFTGIGVSPGLGTKPDPSSVKIRSLFIAQHWMAWHMKPGLNLILSCPITQKGTGESCCTEHFSYSSGSLAYHLANRHNQRELRLFVDDHCLPDRSYVALALQGGPNSPAEMAGGTKKQLAELIRQWITAPYAKLVVDPRKVACDNLDACETLGPEITGMVFRREWRFGGNLKGTHYQSLITLLEKWRREGKTNYPDGLAYEPTVCALAAFTRFRSLRDGKFEEDFCPLLPKQREQFSRRTLKTIKVSNPVRCKLQERRVQKAGPQSLKLKGRTTPSASQASSDTSFVHPLTKRPEQKGSESSKRSAESEDFKGAKKSKRDGGKMTPIPTAVLPHPDHQLVHDSRANQRGNQKLTTLESQQKELEWFLGEANLVHLSLWKGWGIFLMPQSL
ncbi:MAG: hypothetical protein GY702_04590 [Desulfobulbaceae bacterium]|nr:hypothetical protein [Desulfobulbaceae bacterium]